MLIGYEITAVTLVSFIIFLSLLIYNRKEIGEVLRKRISKLEVALLVLIVIFFVSFSVLFVVPTEQLYFDESIYQGIALNVLEHGNALWCQYGTAYTQQCFSTQLYHDPVGWSVFLAIAFEIFGIGINTAYGAQLFIGALSIVGVFLLSSLLIEKKGFATTAALMMAVAPSLFIWSRTQAVTDLPFMTFSIFTFFFFVLFIKKTNTKTFAIFASCLVMTLYFRIEAMLLVPIFVVLYFIFDDRGVRKGFKQKIAAIWEIIDTGALSMLVLLFFFILITPQIYYISIQAQTGDYGQSSSSQHLLSLANFNTNAPTNLYYLFGNYDQISGYPNIFGWPLTVLAVVGAVLLLFEWKNKARFGILALLGLWFIAYFLFYGFFYAGSATYGVDSRFMLQLLPELAIFATIGIYEIYRTVSRRLGVWPARIAYAALIFAFAIYPFIYFMPLVTLPLNQMPQQHGISTSVNFIYQNYKSVPTSCLVFSFTPDIWYELNRSATQIGYIGSSSYNFSQFSCFVIDYGYWCNVPPYKSTTCQSFSSEYNLSILATNNSELGSNVTLYKINNYT